MIKKLVVLLWYSFLFCILFQGQVEAYGPVTHVHLGCEALSALSLLAPPLHTLLRSHSHAFLYGNVAADVIIAKNLAATEKHCHNWNVGFSVLEEAEGSAQQAFAWGYLCHLAADVVAHNYFVPWKLIEGFSARTTGHAYWEIRLDQKIPTVAWELVQGLSQQPLQEHHALLSRTIEGTIFKFETNLTIFNGMLFVQRLKRWRMLLNRVEKRSKWELPPSQTNELLVLSTNAVMDLLCHGKQASVCQADPTGIPNLEVAKQIRKMLKKQVRRPTTESQELIKLVKETLHSQLFRAFSAKRWPSEYKNTQQVIHFLKKEGRKKET